jgi:ribosome-associated protein
VPLDIAPGVVVVDDELEWKFIRASGPGGQNVNKVSSAVQLRFNLAINLSIPVTARNRLRRIAGQKLNDDGTILITARSERSQEQNRRVALERLAELIRTALIEPKIRRKTKPSKASKQRRIDTKKHRGATKSGRSGRWD